MVLLALLPVASDGVAQVLDLHIGPLVGPPEVIGRGGATTGFGEGAAAMGFTPVAAVQRPHHQRWSRTSAGVGFNVLRSQRAGGREVDLLNDGSSLDGTDRLEAIFLSVAVQHRRSGFGLHALGQELTICGDDRACERREALRKSGNRAGLVYGHAFLGGDLLLATELTIESFAMRADNRRVNYEGATISLGALYRPESRPWRIGLLLRPPRRLELESGGADADVFAFVPDGAHGPWELVVGGVLSLGPRPLNPRVEFRGVPRMERPDQAELPRRYLLVLLDLGLVEGGRRDGTSVRAFAVDSPPESSRRVRAFHRFGLEGEPWANRLRLRGGSYWEPGRFEGVSGRLHGTVGADVRLFRWLVDWRLSAALDMARQYHNTVVSVGFWN
ncbi:MAG: hypothetical protein EA398_16535 [Deltaproteobacteria bacterium]|nr:MAG: hypothetical protein EA398_16535 [Deltaproteobacteria bacterium]